MIRLLLTVSVGLFIHLTSVLAQVSVYTPNLSPVSTGQTIEIPVLVKNFQNIRGFQFAVKWDSTVLEFVEGKNFNLPNFSAANFGLFDITSGVLRVNWFESDTFGVDKADGTHIFKLKLKVIGANLSSSFIEFGDYPPTFPAEFTQRIAFSDQIIPFEPTSPGQIGVGFTIATHDIDGLRPTDFDIFPNPFSDRITVRLTDHFSSLKNCRIRLTDCTGRLLFEKNGADLNSDGMEIANLISYSKGIYFLTIQAEHGTFSTRLVRLADSE